MKANAPLWIVSLGQGGGDSAAVGGPGAPVITNPEGGSVIAFTAGEEGAAGPTLGYGASIEPEGPALLVDVTDPAVGGEIVLSGSQPLTDYVVTIYGVNVAGRGKSAQTDPFQLNFNEATGGTETIVDNYNGTTEKWKLHTFTSNGTFTVDSAVKDFRVLCVAGGGGGAGGVGNNAQGGVGGSGGAGGVLELLNEGLSLGDFGVAVGNGGGGVTGDNNPGTAGKGGTSRLTKPEGGDVVATTGGGGGSKHPSSGGASGGSGGGGCSFVGNWGGPSGGGGGTLGQGTNGNGGGAQNQGPAAGGRAGDGLSVGHQSGGRPSTITGSSQNYAPGSGFGGGGNGKNWSGGGSAGQKGVVIVAYQIGTSTTREIAQAQAQAASREAGYAFGHEDGVAEGRQQRDTEIAETFADAKDAVKEAKPKQSKKKAD